MDDFISSEKSENTVKKTSYEWKKFETFCKEQSNGSFNVKNVPADAPDKLLFFFLKTSADVRNQNGGEYEPDSLSSLFSEHIPLATSMLNETSEPIHD